jgi:hypothetical protein
VHTTAEYGVDLPLMFGILSSPFRPQFRNPSTRFASYT